jgi:methenyltetrahydrofolate cyclohydrolase
VSSYLDDRLSAFLERVAAREPAPGGGAAAAMTASLAASLVAMAARYSVGRLPDADRLVENAERLRRRAAELADLDAEAYGPVIAAYQAVREGKSSDRQEVRTALRRAAEVPLEIAAVGAETAKIAAKLAAEGKRDVRGDASTALLLAEAATRSAAHLVRVNITAAGGGEELLRRATDSAAAARAAVVSAPDLP